jgi:2-amino-4-hydroxy-6-hydroxymethyldihydropteridine diphosphokinase
VIRQDALMTYAAIALGSNLGQSFETLTQALEYLHHSPGVAVVRQSSIYRTKPVGPPQPDYLNACAILETDLEPAALLHTLQQIEHHFGRVRQERWGARTLDLDLLLFNNRIFKTNELELPHPRMRERAFVLVPLAEIAADWIDPISQRAIADLVCQVNQEGIQRFEPPQPEPGSV